MIVSHELRTPLTSIRGVWGLMESGIAGAFPDKVKPLLEIALSNCDRLLRLINNLLDIERIESGKTDFQMKQVNISLLILQVVEANMAYAEGFEVSLEIEDLLPKNTQIVIGDADRLNQVLTNLISNAVKFSLKNEKVIVQASAAAGKLWVQVIDRGSGISEEFRDKIFQKFAKANVSHASNISGTGLGLSISKAIIDKMGGTIGFNCSHRGTAFYFCLDVSAGEINDSY